VSFRIHLRVGQEIYESSLFDELVFCINFVISDLLFSMS
jgi:hypothetical protein